MNQITRALRILMSKASQIRRRLVPPEEHLIDSVQSLDSQECDRKRAQERIDEMHRRLREQESTEEENE